MAVGEPEIAVLRLRSWSESPIAIDDYSNAALSPSLGRLLLVSDSGNAILVNLQRSETSDQTNPSTPCTPVHKFSSPLPITPFWSPSIQHSTPYFSPCSSFSTPCKRPRDLPCAQEFVGLVSFAWGCQSDSYGSDGISGLFQELLVTCDDKCLAIYGFPLKNSNFGTRSIQLDAELQSVASEVRLSLEKSQWAAADAEIVCFKVPYESSSFSRLVRYANGEEGSNVDVTCRILKLFSNTSNTLGATLFGSENRRQSIVISTVHDKELRWRSHVTISEEGESDTWVDLRLSCDRLLRLTENGKIDVWEAVTGKYVVTIDVRRYCEMNYAPISQDSKSQFLHMVVTENCLMIAVTDTLGQVFLVDTDEYFSKNPMEESKSKRNCKDLSVISSWAVAGLDISTYSSYSSLPNRLWLKSLDEAASSYPKKDFLDSSKILRRNAVTGPSGFTSKAIINRKKIPCKAQCSRKILLPLVPDSETVAIAVNSCTVTRMFKSSEKGKYTLMQSRFQIDNKSTARDTSAEYFGAAIGFCWQGLLYIVTAASLDVVLPPLTVKRSLKSGFEGQWWHTDISCASKCQSLLTIDKNEPASLHQWKMALVDRALIYDGLEEAEHLSSENGWNVKLVRLRKLQLLLDYGRIDEIRQMLEALVPVNAAETGVLRVLFSAMELMLNQFGSDNELAQAARLLLLAARFTIKLINCRAVDDCWSNFSSSQSTYDLPKLSRFLEAIRSLQDRLNSKQKRPKKEKADTNSEVHEIPVPADGTLNGISENGSLLPVASLGISEVSTSVETPNEMVGRWEKENLDTFSIVKDALRVGRIPLAVVELHRRKCETVPNPQEAHVFKEVQDVGRAIVYDLLCKGQMQLAIAALRRLGEDINNALYDLAFGTVRRSLRSDATNELKKHVILGADDVRIMQTVSSIENVYPSNSFWCSYNARLNLDSTTSNSSFERQPLRLVCSSDFVIECGEIDGVVLGAWSEIASTETSDEIAEENSSPAYWAGAAVWLHAWDQQTIDRMILEQSAALATNISWESRLSYATVHHLWAEISTLIESVPLSALKEIDLHVCLNSNSVENPVLYAEDELAATVIIVPKVKHLMINLEASCTSWLWQEIERKLARNGIFSQMHWSSTTKILCLLGRAGLIFDTGTGTDTGAGSGLHVDTLQMIHEIVVWHCVQFHLPHFLVLYLDRHSLALDAASSSSLQAVVAGVPWASWLLFFRQKGYEYEASLENARTILGSTVLSDSEPDDGFLLSLDDLARSGNEMMAISTMMYAPYPPQKCIHYGTKKHISSSWQCSLQNLKSGLHNYPTLWSNLKSSCSSKSGGSDTALSYLEWRESLFSSSNSDTSLLLMMSSELPKGFRKLIQLSIQGPDGEEEFEDPISWEASIRRIINMELYDHSAESFKSGFEYHLLQGCPMEAFNHFLSLRERAGLSHTDSLTKDEEKLLTSVMAMGISNFENTAIAAACGCFVELCGVPATVFRTDVAVLRRITDYYKHTKEQDASITLVTLLADEYMKYGCLSNETIKQPRDAYIKVLKHLEMAIIKDLSNKDGLGMWLRNGGGDGQQLRSVQWSMSESWCLVTTFCRIHHLPPSTLYLSNLARDNDWVGFLAEGQAESCSLDLLSAVASSDFTDARLRSHVLTVLKSLSPRELSESECFQTKRSELFGLMADIESSSNPGRDLIQKAKDLRWPLLAVVASCFHDVTPLSCLIAWLEITARETAAIKLNDGNSQIASSVGAAVDATNATATVAKESSFEYSRINPKRRRIILETEEEEKCIVDNNAASSNPTGVFLLQKKETTTKGIQEHDSLAKMVAVLCENLRFLPLLRAFELFLPASPLLHFIRFLRAFSQMRLAEAGSHLGDFSALLKEEIQSKGAKSCTWITKAAIAAADAMLAACPSAYERRCMLQLLAAADFGDGGVAAMRFRRFYWKIQLAEPALHQEKRYVVDGRNLDDEALLTALESCGQWEEARSWARQLDLRNQGNPSSVHHVTEMQAEAMVTEWKELLWDVPEQRSALWPHCQTLFTKHSFPPLKAGMFFLKHAEDIEREGSPAELHKILLLALQWLSGSITGSAPVYPIHLLRELETRVWLLAVESEVMMQQSNDIKQRPSGSPSLDSLGIHNGSPVDRTAAKIAIVDSHLKIFSSLQVVDTVRDEIRIDRVKIGSPKIKRRLIKRLHMEDNEGDDTEISKGKDKVEEESSSGWEEKVGEGEVERAILSLVEVGQVSAARQLQQKLSPKFVPSELLLAETAHSVAMVVPTGKSLIGASILVPPVLEILNKSNVLKDVSSASPLQVLEALTIACREGCGRGLCRRITTVAQISNFFGLPFSEAFQKQPTELLQLLSLKGQDALTEAKLLVATHSINPGSIARILAESFLKGLLAAHRGGYMDSSNKEEGPAPLLWRASDFVQWGQLCPSQPELGHALMRLVISGHDMPHACEVELLILAHRFYESSACLDGMDVLVALAATRVEAYVSEGDFPALARLVTGVSNFQALRFVLDLLIENGQLELLLKKRAAVDATKESSASVRGIRMAVLSALKHFNPHDLDAFSMVFSHFSMAHEMANLLESRARKGLNQWSVKNDPDQNEELLDIMRFFVEASEVYAGIDCGKQTSWCCAQASLLSLQLRMPELTWLNLTETNARRLLVEQRRFQEALIVAEAYDLNQPAEWVPVLWNQVLSPGWIEHFLNEFVNSLSLPASMLMELARIYRSEVSARGEQLDFSKWLTAGMPLEFTRSFRSILKHVSDVRLRMQLATLASGFPDVIDTCARILDKVPDTSGPLILKKGHGGTYVPLM